VHIPVILVPEELLSKSLRGQRIKIYALLGFMTPTGNIKWIPARHMIHKAIETGLVAFGGALVEPTSGNMGLSLAYCAMEHDITVHAVVSDNLPQGKITPLLRYGANVIKESEAVKMLGLHVSPGSIELSRLLAAKIPAVFMNQYAHPWNPESYTELIAPQLWKGTGGEASVSLFAVGSTGGMLGLGGYFKMQNPRHRVIATMPYPGQEIDGTRDAKRLESVTQPWKNLPDLIDPVDQIVARARSAELNEYGIPGGPSAGATLGSLDHYLLMQFASGKLDSMRDSSGDVCAIITFADTLYPYA
jgi:cysteine synthase